MADGTPKFIRTEKNGVVRVFLDTSGNGGKEKPEATSEGAKKPTASAKAEVDKSSIE